MNDLAGELWKKEVNLSDFITHNYSPYTGDESFLAPVTERTSSIHQKVLDLFKQEHQKGGVLDVDTQTPSSIISHTPGYIDKANEIIVGLQTDAPLKRSIMPNGGIKLVERAANSYGYKIDPEISKIYTRYRKTHNDGVFSVYTEELRLLRKKHVLTGLPDNYSRGRIIGDYRRVALYGVDFLIADRTKYLQDFTSEMSEENIRLREEIWEQIKALEELKQMAYEYGYDISKPASDTKEVIQWIYFAYLAATKQQDGAAMSIGRLDTFIDIYAQKDLSHGKYNESQIQEMIDDFVIKLRMIRFLRTPEYDELFAGGPNWVTLTLAGSGVDGRPLVTKTSFRFLHTLTNLGPHPEPNLTVLWSKNLPQTWTAYCAKQSIRSCAIQYENDDLMKKDFSDDYAIACCVSAMRVGKDMQLFGARANIAKALLLAINGGREEPLASDGSTGGEVVIPDLKPLANREYLNFDEVWNQYVAVLNWIAQRYVSTMNIIHYMHDKYHYESLEMALHDPQVRRLIAFGAAGLSVVADSLSAIKYAKVKPLWNENNVAEGYEIEGSFPKFGNDDERVDSIAREVTREFVKALRKHAAYREAVHTLSILTITSNVVYGQATGATPDGRKSGEPFAPGANPMHGRDSKGAIASLNSVAAIHYEDCMDGISNTFSIVPQSLGKSFEEQTNNLVQLLNGYFIGKEAHHLNVNVLDRQMLLDAQQHPEKYPQLTIRVSGYAVMFNNLNKVQQDEVISRTFHSHISE
ncbi:MAG: Pyruvate formate-lyase [candidate division WS6 bacterium GW2011_GWF2_39_15]|uniref:Formate acetyltransferase n=1 Tax=candidate division WS6 bacterium GW2011_GWF2_39_15 TaxID=1619100 RepID=A0A0G0N003_9BACT|nr:MAG: Pyruvate formate-lyase [candidate division WS6 bacterium GW2011_GWF2_39_15]